MTTTRTTTSADGTTITYDVKGQGPTLVLVPAVLSTRAWDPLYQGLLDLLSADFTVVHYDRRGRGDSGNTAPYSVDKEIQDIAAVIKDNGGQAYAYGISSGAVLTLRAAEQLPELTRIALYDPPFIVDDSRPPLPDDYVEQLERAIAEGRRGDAVELLMTKAIGLPPEWLAGMKADPSWAGMEAVADTISHDGRIVGTTMSGRPLPAEWKGITTPTLVLNGGNSEPFMHTSGRQLADLLPHAEHQVVPDQSHDVAPAAVAPFLRSYLKD
ncbi:alpha/beta hydrolase [Asanoa sp. WMMD1127]|uniref:alpha/beta fold hydrolase n=1 Tax=Asanoa sp. WMMD1127 TaxID=3016107 RepID=UPI002417AC39|nr:alpha/beta hydrolase [Asanoa sp. WMMD1127]MDG4827561.1 alpha/beta hydrolase [Asanoa sp. WMMD1127]